jgi:glutamyl-tRNA reductase
MAVERKEDEARQPLPILPVALLLEGRTCLVVGAGNVAARKAEHLVEAGARVTVIGERISDAVRVLHARGVVRLEKRAFQGENVEGCAVVFAATDDADANLRVLEACRRRGILCGCVDLHWREGDLISPAVLRTDDITVAVSTGGRSCRRSRLVRDSLARHLAGVDSADLLVIGTSHQQIPLQRLEGLCLAGRLEETGRLLRGVWGLHEFLLLSTCNRVELWALAAAAGDVHELLRRALGLGTLEPGAFYVQQGFDAFEHASLLAAGLLSQTPGENHIVAQVKDAIATAERFAWSGSIVREWISNVLHTSKAIRAATAGIVRSGDVEDLVLRFLAAQRPDFPHRPGMVIGTGAVGRRLVEQLMARPGHARLFWCYRSRPPELRPEWKGRVAAVRFSDIGEAMKCCEYVVAAANGTKPVLQPVHAAMLSGTGEVLIVDVGFPRNVDPELAGLAAGVRLVNLDDLKQWQGRESNELSRAIALGQRIVGEHRDLYEKSIHNVQRRYTDE